MERLNDSYTFFMEGRRWFFGMLLAVNAFDIADTFLKGMEWGLRPIALLQYTVVIAACVAGIGSERRVIQIAAAAAAFMFQLI